MRSHKERGTLCIMRCEKRTGICCKFGANLLADFESELFTFLEVL
jgi:hypothetical protein